MSTQKSGASLTRTWAENRFVISVLFIMMTVLIKHCHVDGCSYRSTEQQPTSHLDGGGSDGGSIAKKPEGGQ